LLPSPFRLQALQVFPISSDLPPHSVGIHILSLVITVRPASSNVSVQNLPATWTGKGIGSVAGKGS